MKSPRKLALWVASFTVVGLPLVDFSTQAAPMRFGNHYFDFISASNISWQAASNAAAASSFMGITGHLATVMSGAENSFLQTNYATFPGFAGAWLGGQVNSANTGFWVAGPASGLPFSQGGTAVSGAYANWGGIEPNNAPSAPYMNIGPSFAGIQSGQWADAANGLASDKDPVAGYFVEYESPVPAPLLNLTVANSSAQLYWLGLTNVTYLVQISTDFTNWNALGYVTATQTNVNYTDPNLQPLRFYRLFVP